MMVLAAIRFLFGTNPVEQGSMSFVVQNLNIFSVYI